MCVNSSSSPPSSSGSPDPSFPERAGPAGNHSISAGICTRQETRRRDVLITWLTRHGTIPAADLEKCSTRALEWQVEVVKSLYGETGRETGQRRMGV